MRAAEYLAGIARDVEPNEMSEYELGPVDQGLPKVAYIHHNTGAALYGWSDFNL